MGAANHWGVLLLVVCAVGAGCWPRQQAPLPATPHFDEFPRLARAVSMGRTTLARTVVQDLAGDNAGHAHHEAEEQVGGARGFLLVASTAEEQRMGLVRLAQACGSCHGSAGLAGVAPAAWSHATAAEWLMGGMVFGYPVDLPSSGDVPAAVSDAWTAGHPSDESRVEAVLAACHGCHGEGQPRP